MPGYEIGERGEFISDHAGDLILREFKGDGATGGEGEVRLRKSG